MVDKRRVTDFNQDMLTRQPLNVSVIVVASGLLYFLDGQPPIGQCGSEGALSSQALQSFF